MPVRVEPTKALLALCLGGALLLILVQNQRFEQRLAALDERLAALTAQPRAVPLPGPLQVAYPELARQVADEIARRQAKSAPGAPCASVPATTPPTAEQAQQRERAARTASEAVQQANEVLDGALARGRLTRDDVQEMREYVASLSDPSAANPLRSRIAQLLNTNRLVVEDPAFIYP